jgi:serine protease Do
MPQTILKLIGVFILGILGGIFGSQILGPYLVEVPFFYLYREPPPIYINKTEKIIIQENTALINAIEKVEKAIIGVKAVTKKGRVLEGSGLIMTSDGLAVTLADLVPQGANFSFYFEGKKLEYQILKRDSKKNLALIKIEENNMPTASFGNFDKTKPGERVFLVGTIFEKEEPKKITNEGIIKYFGDDLIQTNIYEKRAAGSALFDIEGRVLGLNQTTDEEVSAIPISKLKEFANL